jgi:hypothetical protein
MSDMCRADGVAELAPERSGRKYRRRGDHVAGQILRSVCSIAVE